MLNLFIIFSPYLELIICTVPLVLGISTPCSDVDDCPITLYNKQ